MIVTTSHKNLKLKGKGIKYSGSLDLGKYYFSFVCEDCVPKTAPIPAANESEQSLEEEFPRSPSPAPSPLSVSTGQLRSWWQQDQGSPEWGHGQGSVSRLGGRDTEPLPLPEAEEGAVT